MTLPAITREYYVQYVAQQIGFHTPPVDVKEAIEKLYADRISVYNAAYWMRKFLSAADTEGKSP
jgi:hypothetical protein